MTTAPSKTLETFPNPQPDRQYTIRMRIPEFTCLCPKTGQPDFADAASRIRAGPTCVELKSLKLYIWSFRNEGAFHEAVTNRILDDLVAATAPHFMRLTAEFGVRGGIYTTVVAEHRAPGWTAPAGRIALGDLALAFSCHRRLVALPAPGCCRLGALAAARRDCPADIRSSPARAAFRRRCWPTFISSVRRMPSLTWSNGGGVNGLTMSRCTTCQPNSVLIGTFVVSPFFSSRQRLGQLFGQLVRPHAGEHLGLLGLAAPRVVDLGERLAGNDFAVRP